MPGPISEAYAKLRTELSKADAMNDNELADWIAGVFRRWPDAAQAAGVIREFFAKPAPGGPATVTGKVYILDNRTVVGNCALFWAPDGNGYTCDLEKAGLYDPGYSSRDTDIDIPADIAKACAVTHVRLDTLRAEMEKRGLKLRNGRK